MDNDYGNATDYHGYPTGRLANDWLALEYLATAGPRIVRLMRAGSDENLLAETPDTGWETPHGRYNLFGGHRLWHAPEARVRSSIPDNDGLRVEPLADGVRLVGKLEAPTGIRKGLEIRLLPGRPAVRVAHSLVNEGPWPVTLAPWAITQLPLGGEALLPQDAGAVDPDGVLPNRGLVAWPYTRWTDPRLRLEDDFIYIAARPFPAPIKVGCFTRQGWAGYRRDGLLFRKHFVPRPGEPHPDLGCNVEVYSGEHYIELETLGPLVSLSPGEAAEHVEEWEVLADTP